MKQGQWYLCMPQGHEAFKTVILEEPYMDIKIIRFPFKLHVLQKEQYGEKFKSKKSNTTIQFWVRREP